MKQCTMEDSLILVDIIIKEQKVKEKNSSMNNCVRLCDS